MAVWRCFFTHKESINFQAMYHPKKQAEPNLRRKGIWCNLDAKGERIFLVKWMPTESFVGFLGPLKVTNRLFQVQYFYVAKFGGPQLPAVEAPNPQSATSWGVGLPVTLEASSHIRIKGFREKSWWYVGPLNFQTHPPNGDVFFHWMDVWCYLRLN